MTMSSDSLVTPRLRTGRTTWAWILAAGAVAVLAVAGALWWVLGQGGGDRDPADASTIAVADWHTDGRCAPKAFVPQPRIATTVVLATYCFDPASTPTTLTAQPGFVIATFALTARDSAPGAVDAVTVDRARHVLSATAPAEAPLTSAFAGTGQVTLFFVSIPRDQLPTTPFALDDYNGPVVISAIA